MAHSFRHAHDHREDLDATSTARAVGRSSLTQRHVARMNDQDRAADHAQRDAAWRNIIQRKDGPAKGSSHDEPTAGPSEDDRYGAGAGTDLHGRIVHRSLVGANRFQIMIGLGYKQGVRPNMSGYVVAGDGMLCEFELKEIREATTFAVVTVAEQEADKLRQAVINPSTRPGLAAPRKDMRGRVVSISLEHERTRIVIGLGERHGARWGMKGHLIGSGGRPVAPFEPTSVDLDTAVAYVEEPPDYVRNYMTAVLNPSH